MSPITSAGCYFNISQILKGLIDEGFAPFICTLLSGDEVVSKTIYRDESAVEGFLAGLELYGNEKISLNTVISKFKNGEMCNVNVIKFSDQEGQESCLLIERIIPVMSIIIFGAGHVGKAVAELALLMGWEVTIVDDRVEFLNLIDEGQGRGKIKRVNESFEVALSRIKVNKNSALVIVTRGHQFDEICLSASLEAGVFYIGMIGSRRRVLSIKRKLESKGIEPYKLVNLHAPIGLNIGAKTPQEIAVAIIAEIIGVKNLRNTEGSDNNV